jgi:nickel transport protein
MSRFFASLILAALLLIPCGVAQAHKVSIFATAQGNVIEGECYFSGGGQPEGATLQVLGPDGGKIGETTTDSNGQFRFVIKSAVDHTFVLDTGDGHKAEFTVTAAEIGGAKGAAPPVSSPEAVSEEMPAAQAPVPDDLDRRISGAVAKAVQPLRRQIDAYQSRATLHDILGGIGYIVGVMGLLFFLLGRKRPNAGR